MPITTDTFDIALLRNNKNGFILQCQRILEIVVKHFIKTGLFTHDQFHDVMQSANVELIRRLPIIEKNFDNRVLMITYMNVVIRNICLRIHEQEQDNVSTVPLINERLAYKEENYNALLIQDEIKRLELILQLYHTQQYKIIVCLKIYFTMPITLMELQQCFRKSSRSDRVILFERFGRNYDDSLESDNFNMLATFMNKQEYNSTSGDSLRRWTQEHLHKIITLLNGKPPSRSHTKDTIKILLEQCST